MLELVEAFYAGAAHAPQAVRRHHVRTRGPDLGAGRPRHWRGRPGACGGGLQQMPLGSQRFIYVVAPHHPLAQASEPIADAVLVDTGRLPWPISALRRA